MHIAQLVGKGLEGGDCDDLARWCCWGLGKESCAEARDGYPTRPAQRWGIRHGALGVGQGAGFFFYPPPRFVFYGGRTERKPFRCPTTLFLQFPNSAKKIQCSDNAEKKTF